MQLNFLYHRKALFTFLNYNIFHKLLPNTEILIALWLLPYKLCKNNLQNLIGIKILFKKF